MLRPSPSTQAGHPSSNIYLAQSVEGRRREAGDFREVQALVGGLGDIASKTTATMGGGRVKAGGSSGQLQLLFSLLSPKSLRGRL